MTGKTGTHPENTLSMRLRMIVAARTHLSETLKKINLKSQEKKGLQEDDEHGPRLGGRRSQTTRM
jgi:hypothetical protein